MAISRGTIVFFFMTLFVCSLLVKASKAEDCSHPISDENQRCADYPEEEDDFDDTYKIVDNMKVSAEMIILGH